MIKLNNRDYPWQEGLSIEKLMQENNFIYARIIVTLNSKVINQEEYATTIINDGDKVKAIHLMAGG